MSFGVQNGMRFKSLHYLNCESNVPNIISLSGKKVHCRPAFCLFLNSLYLCPLVCRTVLGSKVFTIYTVSQKKNWTLLLQASVLFFEQLIIIFVSFGVQNGIRFKSFHYIHCVSEKNWTLLHLSITLTNNNFNNFL